MRNERGSKREKKIRTFTLCCITKTTQNTYVSYVLNFAIILLSNAPNAKQHLGKKMCSLISCASKLYHQLDVRRLWFFLLHLSMKLGPFLYKHWGVCATREKHRKMENKREREWYEAKWVQTIEKGEQRKRERKSIEHQQGGWHGDRRGFKSIRLHICTEIK